MWPFSDDTSAASYLGDLPADIPIKLVKHLGTGEEGKEHKKSKRSIIKHGFFGSHAVHCDEDHLMEARVCKEGVREPFWQVACGSPVCTECGEDLSALKCSYVCEQCNYRLCGQCSREQLGLPVVNDCADNPVELLPGDIIMTMGGKSIATHHVMLVCGKLEFVPQFRKVLEVPPEAEVWACKTIESTGLEEGHEYHWHSAYTFFSRDKHSKTLELVGDITEGDDEVCVAEEPVRCKVLLHPLRTEFGGQGLDGDIFRKIVHELEIVSKAWSISTCTKAFLSRMFFTWQGGINPENYKTEKAKEDLMESLQNSWVIAPICASVPVKVWQRYIQETSVDTVAAADLILSNMPLHCQCVVPSIMIKRLSEEGWVLIDNLE